MSKSNLSILSTPSLNGAELAYLRAHAASGTGVADEGLTVLDLHGRAPELHAALAALAQVVQHFELLSPDAHFLSGDNAGLAGDDDLNAVGVVGFLERRLRRFQVKRIDDLERGYAAGLDERLERDLGGWLIQYVGSGSGVLLMAGHRRRPVIQDDDRYIRLIIDGVDQPRDARMDESRVPDGTGDLVIDARMAQARCDSDAGAHAEARIDGTKLGTQRIAAYVAGENGLVLEHALKRVKSRPVRTARTHDRRPGRQLKVQLDVPVFQGRLSGRLSNDVRDEQGIEFALVGHFARHFAQDVGRVHPGLLLDERGKLFDDQDALHVISKLLDQGRINGICADLEVGNIRA